MRQAWRLEAARRLRHSRAAPASPAHLAQALAPAQLAVHVAWSPALDPERALLPVKNPMHAPTKFKLGISLDGGLVAATAELGALQSALGCLLAFQHALRLGPDTPTPAKEGPEGLHAPVAPEARAAAGRQLGAPLAVHVALQCVRMDVRTRCPGRGRARDCGLKCLFPCKRLLWCKPATGVPETHVLMSEVHGAVACNALCHNWITAIHLISLNLCQQCPYMQKYLFACTSM